MLKYKALYKNFNWRSCCCLPFNTWHYYFFLLSMRLQFVVPLYLPPCYNSFKSIEHKKKNGCRKTKRTLKSEA